MNSFERPSPNSARTVRAYAVEPETLLRAARVAVESLPRWTLESVDETELHAVRQTRIFRFKDDVTVVVSARGRGSEASFESASRVGKGDLGQNPRNLQELIRAIDRILS